MIMKLHLCGVYVIINCLTVIHAHYTHQWAVHIDGDSSVADAVALDHGFINHGQIFDDYYHFTHDGVAKRSLRPNRAKRAHLAVDTRVKWAKQQIAKNRNKRQVLITDSDPKWPSMWYLNRGNGLDMNVVPAWLEGVIGRGAVVTTLDDGLEKDHPDLIKNYDPLASFDVNGNDNDPSPRYDLADSNRHGTRCAGVVAATNNNSICALGVAYGAKVGGVRMLDGDVTDSVEARSLSLNPNHVDIYSASWGPDDDGKTVDGPSELATRAIYSGVTKGRNGKGSIFVWASGNGGRDHDNCNCDGYTNSIYSLSISSATEYGKVPWYSEACSSTLATTYSSGADGDKQVVTTDLRHACTSSHTGTSASAPLAAGICALALEANSNLTWRDMQHIVVRTARSENLHAPDWQVNGVGRNVSHHFGYGLMDAHAMVKLARRWITVPEQHHCEITATPSAKIIPPKSFVSLKLTVKECEGVAVLEHVQAKLTIQSARRGDLNIKLTSPAGTNVTLLDHRVNDISRSGFNNWPFMSVHSWGESPLGDWHLEIHNDGRLLGRATLQNWTLVLYGTNSFSPKLSFTGGHRHSNTNSARPKLKKKNKKPKNKSKKFKNKSWKELNHTSVTGKTKRPYFSTDSSPYFYSVDSKLKLNQDSAVREYLKFVKNITITYPVMIPARDMKTFNRKTQRLKEKSRDINLERKVVSTSTTTTSTSTTIAPKIKPVEVDYSEMQAKETTESQITAWTMTMYGTASLPGVDMKIYQEEIYNEELTHNSVDEIRASGCSQTNSNLCVLECPKQYYSTRSNECLPCHYSCQRCTGPLDSECSDCFSDSQLFYQSSSEVYCYPKRLVPNLLAEKWFHWTVILLIVTIFIFVIGGALGYYIKWKSQGQIHYLPLRKSEIDSYTETT